MVISDIYKKVTEFEARVSEETRAGSNCRNGCSRCCYTDISVFQVEAQEIERGVLSLSEESRNELLEKWKTPVSSMLNFRNEEVKSCSFLVNESCSIYEVRPLICRTQGLALSFKDEDNQFLDICPLNESMLDAIKENEIMNLDLLNTILSQIEMLQGGENAGKRIRLSELKDKLWTQLQKT